MRSSRDQIVITGVASGIGKETAAILSAKGYDIIGVDRAALEDFDGTFIHGDLSDQAGIADIAKQISEAAPQGIHGLANIAGVPGTAPIDVVMNINVFGIRDLISGLKPVLTTGSSIVNLASAVAYQWRNNRAKIAGFALADRHVALQDAMVDENIVDGSYLFSKQCVSFLTEYFATEFIEDKIRVNSVSPGPVETPILEDFKNDHGRDKVNSAAQALGRFGTPSDIAESIAFLFSPAARWINGADVRVDGGLTALRETTEVLADRQSSVDA